MRLELRYYLENHPSPGACPVLANRLGSAVAAAASQWRARGGCTLLQCLGGCSLQGTRSSRAITSLHRPAMQRPHPYRHAYKRSFPLQKTSWNKDTPLTGTWPYVTISDIITAQNPTSYKNYYDYWSFLNKLRAEYKFLEPSGVQKHVCCVWHAIYVFFF